MEKKLCKRCGKELIHCSGGKTSGLSNQYTEDLFPDVCYLCLTSDELNDLNSWVSSCTCKRDG